MRRPRNPGKGSFARCVEDVSRRGGVSDPRAVCAASKMKAGEDLQAARRHNQGPFAAYEIESALTNPPYALVQPSTRRAGQWDVFIGGFHRVTKPTKKGAVSYARRIIQANQRNEEVVIRNPQDNPADLAAEAFESFHGYPPENEIVFDSEEHEHEFYAGIGDLERLVIVPRGERKGIELYGFGGAQLAMNERSILDGERAQLYIVGGDQSLDPKVLRQFGIDTSKLHEQEVLGTCVDITYFTIKTHLGRDGGKADYVHAFGEESAKRQMRILVSPTATYHTVNKIIGLWGGKYTIEPEGIRN